MSPGLHGIVGGDHHRAHNAIEPARQPHHALPGALCIDLGDGDRVLHRHGVNVGKLSGFSDLAQAFDLDADFWLLDIFLSEPARNLAGELSRGQIARQNRTDESHRHIAARIDAVEPRIVLTKHDHAHPVAAVEPIGLAGIDRNPGRGVAGIDAPGGGKGAGVASASSGVNPGMARRIASTQGRGKRYEGKSADQDLFAA